MIAAPDPATKTKIRTLLDKIVNVLLQRQYDDLPGLLFGNSGIILFLAYYSRHIKEEEIIYNRIGELIYKAVEQCNSFPIPPFFSTGLPGIGWTFHKLMQIGLLDHEQQDIIDEIARTAEADMIENMEARHMDLLYGFIGQYLFLSESGLMQDSIREQVHNFFAGNNLISDFKTSFAEKEEATNLGLAHGLSGFGLFLHNNNLSDGLLNDIVKQFCDVATAGLLQGKSDTSKFFSVFSNRANLDALTDPFFHSSRYAWCHGDLGILYFLAKQKKKGCDNVSLNRTIDLLLATCRERNLNNAAIAYMEENGCYDIGFCHGLSGIFYLQLKINKLLPSSTPLPTTGYWLNQFLEHLAVFLEREPFTVREGTNKRYDPLSILEGLPGAGLVLIGYLTGDTSWDSCLLLND